MSPALCGVQPLCPVWGSNPQVTMPLKREACSTGDVKFFGDPVEVLSSAHEDPGMLNPRGGLSWALKVPWPLWGSQRREMFSASHRHVNEGGLSQNPGQRVRPFHALKGGRGGEE